MKFFCSLFLVFLFWACSESETAGGSTEATNGIATKDTVVVVSRDTIIYRDTVVISDKKTVAVPRERVTGVIQKGPFEAGSSVILWELKDNGVDFTGRGFKTSTNSKGGYTIFADSLQSKYAVIEGRGRFRNELTGEVSVNEVSLNALVNLTGEDEVNLNALTQMEYERVSSLVRNKKVTVEGAQKQARAEIGTAFFDDETMDDFASLDIFGDSEDDSRLLALSVMMLSYGGESGVNDFMSDVVSDMNAGKEPEESSRKEKLVEAWESSSLTEEAVYENMASWGMGTPASDFADEISKEKTDLLGSCTKAQEWEAQRYKAAGEDVYSAMYICHDGSWEYSYLNPNYEYGTLKDSRDGTVYRTTTIGTQTWMAENVRYMPEGVAGFGCYAGEENSCKTYGGYYESSSAELFCPQDWAVPTQDDWHVLFKYIGGESYDLDEVANKLRAINGWDRNVYNGVSEAADPYGFAVLPAGVSGYGDYGKTAFFITSSMVSSVYIDFGISDTEGVESYVNGDVKISLRCLKK